MRSILFSILHYCSCFNFWNDFLCHEPLPWKNGSLLHVPLFTPDNNHLVKFSVLPPWTWIDSCLLNVGCWLYWFTCFPLTFEGFICQVYWEKEKIGEIGHTQYGCRLMYIVHRLSNLKINYNMIAESKDMITNKYGIYS